MLGEGGEERDRYGQGVNKESHIASRWTKESSSVVWLGNGWIMQCVTPQQGHLPLDGPLRGSLRGWPAAEMNPLGGYCLHLTEVAASRDRLVMSHRPLNKCVQKETVQSFRVSFKITRDSEQLLWGLCSLVLAWPASVVPASILSGGVSLVSRDGKV